MNEIEDFSKVVAKFQKPLRLHDGDAKTILTRFAYLKQKLSAEGPIGIPDLKLLLTSIYCYIRTPGYGRKIVGPYKFVSLCNEFSFSLNHRDLWRYEKLYFQHGLYAPITNAITYFETAWYDISAELGLPATMKGHVLLLIKCVQGIDGPKRAPGIIVGTAVYLIAKKTGVYFLQSQLAEYFGISEVSIRNAAHDFEPCMNSIQF